MSNRAAARRPTALGAEDLLPVDECLPHRCVADRTGVRRSDVAIEDDEIGELSDLDRAGVGVEVIDKRAADRERPQRGVEAQPAGDPQRMELALGLAQALDPIGVRRLRKVRLDEAGRAVVERAGRVTRAVADDSPIARIWGRSVDPGKGQGLRVGPADVPSWL